MKKALYVLSAIVLIASSASAAITQEQVLSPSESDREELKTYFNENNDRVPSFLLNDVTDRDVDIRIGPDVYAVDFDGNEVESISEGSFSHPDLTISMEESVVEDVFDADTREEATKVIQDARSDGGLNISSGAVIGGGANEGDESGSDEDDVAVVESDAPSLFDRVGRAITSFKLAVIGLFI